MFKRGALSMEKNRNYNRIEKLIVEAFLDLSKEKEISRITVSELCRQADINRTSFYAHYQDVWEIPQNIQNEILVKLDETLKNFHFKEFINNPRIILGQVWDFIKINESTYKQLISRSDVQAFLFKLTNLLEDKLLLASDLPINLKTSPDARIKISYFAGGLANIYRRWLEDDFSSLEIDQITEVVAKMIENCGFPT